MIGNWLGNISLDNKYNDKLGSQKLKKLRFDHMEDAMKRKSSTRPDKNNLQAMLL